MYQINTYWFAVFKVPPKSYIPIKAKIHEIKINKRAIYINCSNALFSTYKIIFINFSYLSSLITLNTLIVLKTLITPTNDVALVRTELIIKSTIDRVAITKSKIFSPELKHSTNPSPISFIIDSIKNIIVKESFNIEVTSEYY